MVSGKEAEEYHRSREKATLLANRRSRHTPKRLGSFTQRNEGEASTGGVARHHYHPAAAWHNANALSPSRACPVRNADGGGSTISLSSGTAWCNVIALFTESSMRFFNTAGPSRRENHYTIPPSRDLDLDDLFMLVWAKQYCDSGR